MTKLVLLAAAMFLSNPAPASVPPGAPLGDLDTMATMLRHTAPPKGMTRAQVKLLRSAARSTRRGDTQASARAMKTLTASLHKSGQTKLLPAAQAFLGYHTVLAPHSALRGTVERYAKEKHNAAELQRRRGRTRGQEQRLALARARLRVIETVFANGEDAAASRSARSRLEAAETSLNNVTDSVEHAQGKVVTNSEDSVDAVIAAVEAGRDTAEALAEIKASGRSNRIWTLRQRAKALFEECVGEQSASACAELADVTAELADLLADAAT